MKNIYFPEILKEKIYSSFKYLYAFLLLIISVISAIALLSFDINDNSFLTSTSETSQNLLGDFGSYFASFVFYTFGILGYMIVIFFLINSILVVINKSPKFIFIRLLIFFISLVLIPQTLLTIGVEFFFIESIDTWGAFSVYLYSIYNVDYIGYALSILGVFMYSFSQNIIHLFRLPKFQINELFKNRTKKDSESNKIKKDPIIKNINDTLSNDVGDIEERLTSVNSVTEKTFSSPSLEILESNKSSTEKKLDKENIKSNSDLLEQVFQDFNIDIQVVNVKLGPVITLFEILPAAGIKINTIINLADDISRSMGVGAVRIAQIFGTQYLGVEVPNDQRETSQSKSSLVMIILKIHHLRYQFV